MLVATCDMKATVFGMDSRRFRRLLSQADRRTFSRMRVVRRFSRGIRVEAESQTDPIGMSGFFAVICKIVLSLERTGIPFRGIKNVRHGKTYLESVFKEALPEG